MDQVRADCGEELSGSRRIACKARYFEDLPCRAGRCGATTRCAVSWLGQRFLGRRGILTFTWIDWLIAGIVVISALISLKRGFFKEILSLLTWVAAIFVAWSFGGALSERFIDYIETPSVRVMVACALLFIATLMVGALVNRVIAELVQVTGLSGTDRILGMIFGGLRGCLVVTILVGLLTLAPLEKDQAWKQSVLLPHFMLLADWSKRTVVEFMGPFVQT